MSTLSARDFGGTVMAVPELTGLDIRRDEPNSPGDTYSSLNFLASKFG